MLVCQSKCIELYCTVILQSIYWYTCRAYYPLQDRHHVNFSSHAGCMARDLISIVSMHSCTPYVHMHHMLTHTHYTPAVALSGTSWASWCVHFPPLLSAGERRIAAEGFCPLWDRGLPGKLLLGKEKSESGWQKCFSFGQAKYSAGIALMWKLQSRWLSMQCWKSLMVVLIRCMQSTLL